MDTTLVSVYAGDRTVIDLTAYEASGAWSIVRSGALSEDAVRAAL